MESEFRAWESTDWPRIVVVGAGAVGAYFGARLACAGAPLTMVGRKPFVEAVERDGLSIEAQNESLHLRVRVSTDLSVCREAQWVLLCVKTVDTVSTARALGPHLSSDALVLTMQNGVESLEQIRASIRCHAVAAAVYVAVAMPEPGRVQHFGRGDLVVGSDVASRQVAALCTRAAIPCLISENIQGELWSKLLMNCALNALSALGRAPYARVISCPAACSLIEQVVGELLQVAHVAGIHIPALTNTAEAMAAVSRLVAQMPAQLSSMAQDLARGRRTEIDALNGYVHRRGAQLGVRTPANQALFALIKLLEAPG